MAAAADVMSEFGGVMHDPEPGQPAAPTQSPDAGSDPFAEFGGVATGPAKPDTPSLAPSGGAEPKEDLGGAVLTGLKQTLAPHLLTKEELNGPKTGLDTAVEVGTNLASDVALGAGIGMVVGPEGALIGAGAGALIHVAMAAYRGFGYEYAKSQASGEAFDPMRGIINTAAQLNPLVGKGGKIMAAGRQAALEFMSQYQYNHDTTQAGISGAVGALVAGLAHKNTGEWLAHIGSQASRPSSVTQRAGLSNGEMEGALLLASDDSVHGIGAKTEAAIDEIKQSNPDFFSLGDKLKDAQLDGAPAELKSEMRDFKAWFMDQPGVSGQDADDTMRHYRRVLGEDAIAKDYETYKRQVVQNAQVDKHRAALEMDILGKDKGGNLVPKDQSVGPAGAPEDPVSGLADHMRDIKFVARKIDALLGTNFEGMIGNFSAAKNKASNIAATYIVRANKLVTDARKLGMDQEDIGRWLAEEDINKGRKINNALARTGPDSYPDKFTPAGVSTVGKDWNDKQQAVAQGWRQLYEDARTRLKNEGLTIDFLNQGNFAAGDKYLPMRIQSGPQLAKSLRAEVERLSNKYGQDYLNTADSGDLRRVVSKMLNTVGGSDIEPEAVKYRSQVQQAIDAAIQPNAKTAAGFSGGMTLQREVGMPAPEFARDFDVGKLFLGYINNGLKATIYHDPFVQLNSSLETLRGMGFDRAADYMSKYIGDISGRPGNFVSGITALANKHKDTLERLIEDVDQSKVGAGVKTGALKLVRDVPDFAGFALSSIYPNFLGWNVRAAVRDFAKPFLLTAPELGWDYGLKTVGRSVIAAAWDKVKRGVNIEEELLNRDLMPAKHLGAMGDVTDTGLRSVKGVGAAVEGLEWMNEKSMWMYSQTDKMNRYIQLKVGHQLAQDLQAGDERAAKYVARTLSEGNKSALRDLGVSSYDDLKSVDVKKLGDALGAQLVSKTSFDYGKEGMSAFGREMGRTFSMFTKWPAMMMSDAAEQYSVHGKWGGTLKNTQRYLAPMAAMTLASEYLLDTDNNPYQRFLIGKNLAEWAPAQSWKIGTPPLLQTAQDFGSTFMHLFDADKDKEQKLGMLGKFATRNVLTYLPGAGAYNEYQRWDRANNPGEK